MISIQQFAKMRRHDALTCSRQDEVGERARQLKGQMAILYEINPKDILIVYEPIDRLPHSPRGWDRTDAAPIHAEWHLQANAYDVISKGTSYLCITLGEQFAHSNI